MSEIIEAETPLLEANARSANPSASRRAFTFRPTRVAMSSSMVDISFVIEYMITRRACSGICRCRDRKPIATALMMTELMMTETAKWRTDGVSVVRAQSLERAMREPCRRGRATAFDFAGTGGRETWIGTVALRPNARTGAHHHGRHEVASMSSEVVARSAGASGSNLQRKSVLVILSISRPMYRMRS
jgi:hypothetical protein